ncbi:hypothetical protein [Roseisalinus antarcticus]|uniref:hypothetical protein n=1 Tax=Roseisalinus antarcticus TaxID=254357 RepID=UPI001179FDBF|nr:hypothetical protein [Roseisalinus antarcticus]
MPVDIKQRLMRSLRERWVHRQRVERLSDATCTNGERIALHNVRRPQQALGMKTPAAAFELAA